MPKLDWTLSAFGDEISADLAEQLETLTKYGIHHLEIRSVWGKTSWSSRIKNCSGLRKG